jgi:hypothetical protein
MVGEPVTRNAGPDLGRPKGGFEYKVRNNIIDTGSGRLIDEQRLTELKC